MQQCMDRFGGLVWSLARRLSAGGADTDDALHILELANLQLAELEAYDRHLDATLVRSYREARASGGPDPVKKVTRSSSR